MDALGGNDNRLYEAQGVCETTSDGEEGLPANHLIVQRPWMGEAGKGGRLGVEAAGERGTSVKSYLRAGT